MAKTMTDTIKISSNNSVFFRDGNEATFGGDVFSKGLFPPSPTSIYGAIRAMFFEQKKSFFTEREIEGKDPSLDTYIKGYCLHNFEEALFPLPYDHFIREDLSPFGLDLEPKGFLSNSKFSHCLISSSPEKVQSPSTFLVTKETLNNYLKGEKIEEAIPIHEIVSSEEVTHNALDKNGVVKEGALFVHHQVELEQIFLNENFYSSEALSFCVNIQNENPEFNLNLNATLMLGSDGKPSYSQKSNYNPFEMEEVEFEISENTFLKYYLSTPALFENGYLPAFLVEKSSSFEVLTFATGRSMGIGGYNTKKKEPKAMYRAIPAGTVYYLKVKNVEKAMEVIEEFNGNSSSDYRAKEGYGLGYFGMY